MPEDEPGVDTDTMVVFVFVQVIERELARGWLVVSEEIITGSDGDPIVESGCEFPGASEKFNLGFNRLH